MAKVGITVLLSVTFFLAQSQAASYRYPPIDCRLVRCAPPPCPKPFPPPPGECCPVCEKPDVCSLPPETGPCKALFIRFFHDPYDGQCKPFIYGGCRGNGNNFKSHLECANNCGCPDGSNPVNCFVDPCQFATCPDISNAFCVADYCGGCHARWFVFKGYKTIVEVTDKCNTY